MQQVSIVFQDVYLFNDTIITTSLGRETVTREEIRSCRTQGAMPQLHHRYA